MWAEYFSPIGEVIRFGYDPPYGIVNIAGIGSNKATPLTAHGPAQRGTSLRDIIIGERTIAITISVIASDGQDATYWSLRAALERIMVVEPASFGSAPAIGLLRLYRDSGLPVLELPVIPRESPQYTDYGPHWTNADLEFVAPYPFFRETEDRVFNIAGSGGFTFPITHPFVMPSYNITVIVNNAGDVRAPVRIQIYGDVTNPVVYNDATGEQIRYVGNVPVGSYLEISTEYGNKYVELVTAGVRTNVMANIDQTVTKFWMLRPGFNSVRFSASINNAGYANVYWRQRSGGI